MKNSILSAVMLLEVLLFFLIFDVFAGKVIRQEKWFYAPCVITACLPVIYSLIAYAINPDSKKRVANSYFEHFLIYAFAACVAAVAIYLTCGCAFGMNVNNLSEFYLRLGLSLALALGFIVNSVIYSVLRRTRKYAVK